MKKLLLAASVATLLSACAGMGGMDHDGMHDSPMTNGGTGVTAPGNMQGTTPNGAMPSSSRMSGMSGMANPMVGGATMYRTRDIIDNAVNSKDHTTLVAAVKAAGLVDTLKGAGPFTVFAPTNGAFAALPAGTLDTLLKPENKATLTQILTYHVVAGKLDGPVLMRMIRDGGGRATLNTVSGATLTATANGPNVMLTDTKGGTARVMIADVYQSNGVIHVVDRVMLPG